MHTSTRLPLRAESMISARDRTPILRFDTRYIRVSVSTGREARPDKIHVNGVGRHTKAPEVAAYFQQFGPVRNVTINLYETGQSKGSAFVDFETREGAQAALQGFQHHVPLKPRFRQRETPRASAGYRDPWATGSPPPGRLRTASQELPASGAAAPLPPRRRCTSQELAPSVEASPRTVSLRASGQKCVGSLPAHLLGWLSGRGAV
jgi:hypothetical protein